MCDSTAATSLHHVTPRCAARQALPPTCHCRTSQALWLTHVAVQVPRPLVSPRTPHNKVYILTLYRPRSFPMPHHHPQDPDARLSTLKPCHAGCTRQCPQCASHHATRCRIVSLHHVHVVAPPSHVAACAHAAVPPVSPAVPPRVPPHTDTPPGSDMLPTPRHPAPKPRHPTNSPTSQRRRPLIDTLLRRTSPRLAQVPAPSTPCHTAGTPVNVSPHVQPPH